jgi:capsid protein
MATVWQRLKRVFRLGKSQTRQAWAGAVVNRLNDFVFSTIQSANQELRYELTLLRGRARELSRNNPSARRFLNLLSQNVVGHCGIRLECQTMLKTGPNAGTADEDTNDAIEAAWKDWGRPGTCEVTRRLSWTALQALVVQTVARDGEAFVRIVDGARIPTGSRSSSSMPTRSTRPTTCSAVRASRGSRWAWNSTSTAGRWPTGCGRTTRPRAPARASGSGSRRAT